MQHQTHLPTREEVVAAASRPMPAGFRTLSLILAVVGLVIFLIGLFVNPDRVWQALHFNWLLFASVSSAAIAIVAVQRITTARWSRPTIRFIEGFVAFMPVAFVLLLLLVLVGKNHVFPWTHHTPPVHEKQLWFGPVFFPVRELVFFGVLTLLSCLLIRESLRLDLGVTPEFGASWARGFRARLRRGYGDEKRELFTTHTRMGVISVWLVIFFGFFWCGMAWDMSMGLDMYFQSVLYGWWFFMGAWLGAMMAYALLAMWLRRQLHMEDLILPEHFHDIGKLCFAFTAFWGYLTFGQYLVIWYGNLPEETHWMTLRLVSVWQWVTVLVVFLVFVLPFFGLLAKSTKTYRPALAFFAISSLVGLWLLRYMEVYPSLRPLSTTLPLGVWEVGVGIGVLGLWGLTYAAFMDAFPKVRVVLMSSPYRDLVQVPYDPRTMETLPAHELPLED